MPIWRLVAALLATAILLGAFESAANNLRGQIRRPNPVSASGWLPVGGVTIHLTKQAPNGLQPVDETTSVSDGYFFFYKVDPGDYVLVVDNPSPEKLQFPLHVTDGNEQDIPPVVIK